MRLTIFILIIQDSWHKCLIGVLQKQQNNLPSMGSNGTYLWLYMANFFLIAIPFTSAGALIPFLAEDLGVEQTEYSILFVLTSVTSLVAACSYKILEFYRLRPKHHVVCIICLLGMVLFSTAMAFAESKFYQSLFFSLLNLFAYALVITTNISLLLAPSSEDVGLWMSFSHGVFGVSAILSPLLVAVFQQRIFIILSIICLVLTPFFFFLASPEDKSQLQISPTAQIKQKKHGSTKLQILLAFGFFITVGIEVTIQGWVPTSAVLTGINSKQGAVQFSSIFWTFSSIFRFVFALIKGKDSSKFSALVSGQLLSGVLSALLAVLRFPSSAAYACSILCGISLSQLFPLLLSLGSEFGLHFSGSQISNMMISTTISSGVFSSLTGVLMKWDLNMLFYSLLAFSLLFYYCARMTTDSLKKESGKQVEEKDIELPLVAK